MKNLNQLKFWKWPLQLNICRFMSVLFKQMLLESLHIPLISPCSCKLENLGYTMHLEMCIYKYNFKHKIESLWYFCEQIPQYAKQNECCMLKKLQMEVKLPNIIRHCVETVRTSLLPHPFYQSNLFAYKIKHTVLPMCNFTNKSWLWSWHI